MIGDAAGALPAGLGDQAFAGSQGRANLGVQSQNIILRSLLAERRVDGIDQMAGKQRQRPPDVLRQGRAGPRGKQQQRRQHRDQGADADLDDPVQRGGERAAKVGVAKDHYRRRDRGQPQGASQRRKERECQY